MMTATEGRGSSIGGILRQAGSRKSGTLRFGASRELVNKSKANLEAKIHRFNEDLQDIGAPCQNLIGHCWEI